jgi:hypothetical protein
MIEGIEPLYQKIAESIEATIPESWQTAWMEAVFYPNSIGYTGDYTATDGGKLKSYATGTPGEIAFRELRELFRNAGQPVWCRAQFEIRSDGKFTMDWNYDDSDENGDARLNEDNFLKEKKARRDRLFKGGS